MNDKDGRLRAIAKIINNYKVPSQEHLLKILSENGVNITQATLSRDLKYLKVRKIPDENGEYFCALPEKPSDSLKTYIEDFKRGYISIAFSANLAVIKTLAGHADTVAIALDKIKIPGILGTIAGDDTILIILKENFSKESLMENMHNYFGIDGESE